MSNLLSAILLLLAVTNTECYTQYGPCPDSYTQKLDLVKGQSILKPLPRQKLSEIFFGDPSVESVEFYRRIPHTVVASIKLRKPIGVVGSSVLGVVDEGGIVFGEVKNSVLPKLAYDQPLQTGDRLPEDYIASLSILSQVAAITGQRTEGKLQNKTLTITLNSGIDIIVDISKQNATWAASLQAIFTRSKIDGRQIRKLDLRYLNPVVIY